MHPLRFSVSGTLELKDSLQPKPTEMFSGSQPLTEKPESWSLKCWQLRSCEHGLRKEQRARAGQVGSLGGWVHGLLIKETRCLCCRGRPVSGMHTGVEEDGPGGGNRLPFGSCGLWRRASRASATRPGQGLERTRTPSGL